MAQIEHVVVHEDALRLPEFSGNEPARNVLGEISRIRQSGQPLHSVHDEPGFIPASVSPPSDDLTILVLGTSKWVCCVKQLYSLRAQGYNAELYDLGCYDNGGRAYSFYFVPDARELIPEFFSSD